MSICVVIPKRPYILGLSSPVFVSTDVQEACQYVMDKFIALYGNDVKVSVTHPSVDGTSEAIECTEFIPEAGDDYYTKYCVFTFETKE